jgi:hypothetical protein
MKNVVISRTVMGLIAAAALLAASRGQAAGEVALARAHSHEYNGNGGAPLQHADYQILVKNLAFQKQVFIHGQQADGSWADLPANYVGPADAGREIWRASEEINPGLHRDLRFAVKYVVNGQTFWDNNNGADYTLGRNEGSLLVGRNVALYSATDQGASSTSVAGDIDLKNLAPTKTVFVRYTTDHWAHFTDVNASYAVGPNASGTETWKFTLNGVTPANLELAIAYTVNGQTYWDNNFTANYAMVPFTCTLPGSCPSLGANGLATGNYNWQF